MPATRPLSSCALLATLAALVPACAGDLPPPPPPITNPANPPCEGLLEPPFVPALVDPPRVTEGTVTRIEAGTQVALTGPRVDAKPGAWLLQNAGSVAVVSADGKIVDLGEKGGRDEITAIDPTVFLGLDAAHVEVASIEPAGEGGHVLHVVRRVLEKPLLLHELISFSGDLLRIETAVTAASPEAVAKPVVVTLGERIGWGNVPTWAEGHGFVTRGGTFVADFVARESFGIAYALASEGGRLVARFDTPESGFHEEAATGERPEQVSLDARMTHRVVVVSHARGSLGRAAAALPFPGGARDQRVPLPEGLPANGHVEIGRCGQGSRGATPYARFLPGEREAAVPGGCFMMRLTAPGHTSTPWFALTAAAGRTLPPSGTLRFAVTEKDGGPLPARVVVRGEKGTRDPDWGDDPDAGAALNMIYAETGEGERPLPPGRYKLTLDRGFEYTAVEKTIDVVAGKPVTVHAVLERVVDTRGFIAADLHLHAMPSPDATQPLADRVRALVAAGVEVGVATDHNKVTDYRPTIDELKVRKWMASVVGDEVTTRAPAWGHFNAFPLAAGAAPIAYEGVTPRAIFAAAHAGPLGADGVVQVNHPRMGRIGYLELLRFERDDPAGWTAKIPLADLGFDAMEVFNGDHYALIPKVEECMRDWYALLDAGHRVTATGNSDSHKLAFHEPGVPRNLVAVPNDDPAAFDERAFVAAVRKGKVVVSSGPFIHFEAAGKGVGETVPAGEVPLSIMVDAPPWVDVDRVELVRRGEIVSTWTTPFPKGPHRFEAHLTRPLAKGDWILVVARGTKPMGHLHRPHARPFAFTNPIWVE